MSKFSKSLLPLARVFIFIIFAPRKPYPPFLILEMAHYVEARRSRGRGQHQEIVGLDLWNTFDRRGTKPVEVGAVDEVKVGGSDVTTSFFFVVVTDVGRWRWAVDAGVAMVMSQLVEMLFSLLLYPAKQGAVRLSLSSNNHVYFFQQLILKITFHLHVATICADWKQW